MLRGANALNLDNKGRLAIPGRYRDALLTRCKGRFVVTVNTNKEHCLWMYPLDAWERVEQKVTALPDFDPNHQKLKRFFIGHASDTEMDGNGRVLLPAPLRAFAQLEKEVYLIGLGNKFELWNEPMWNERREQWLQNPMDMDNLSPELEQLSL